MRRKTKPPFVNWLVERLPANRVDPVARIEELVKIARIIRKKRNRQLKGGDDEFEMARYALLMQLKQAQSLNMFDFLEDAQLPPGMGEDSMPEPGQQERWERIEASRKALRDDSCTRRDLLDAFRVVDDAVTSMAVKFRWGRLDDSVPEEESIPELEQYYAGALLGPWARILEAARKEVRKTA